MSVTIIPSDKRQEHRMNNPGKNQIYVGSRQGGHAEAARTKQASIKHQNPEYFKRQSDRKHQDNTRSNENVGRGVGQVGASDIKHKDNFRTQLKHLNKQEHSAMEKALSANSKERKIEQGKHKDHLTTAGPIQRDFNHHQPNVGKDPGRGVGQVGKDRSNENVGRGVGQVGRDQGNFQVKHFAKGTMY